jgi:subfamily B ATP-binding cassette protein MsbA
MPATARHLSPGHPRHSSLDSKTLYLRLLDYARPHWKILLVAIAANALTAAVEPVLPALFKQMLDEGFVAKNQAWLLWMPAGIIGLMLVRGLASFTASYAINWIDTRLVQDLREAMHKKLLSLPVAYFDNVSTSQLTAHVAFNVTQVMRATTTGLTALTKDVLTILGLLGYLLWINWQLTLIIFIAFPPIIWVVIKVSKRLRAISRAAQSNLGHLTESLTESLTAHRIVRLFDAQPYEAERFHERANAARKLDMKRVVALGANTPFVEILAGIPLAIIFYMAIHQAINEQTTVGGFVSFFIAMMLLFPPIKRLTVLNDILQRGLAAAEVVFGILDDKPEPDPGTRVAGRLQGDIRIEHVSLAYPGKAQDALDDIDLHIQPGETLALVGGSGAGKTSLVSLLPRFYAPTRGRLLFDGVPADDYTLASLRANIAGVSQEIVLFNDTLRANIAYGAKRNAADEEIRRAAEAAHAREFIDRLPEGLDTLVGENGIKLSGGQRQRIAIARALLKDAPILILDEATSALDTESERHVQAALENLMQGRTTIVIAHRLSTVENADRIVVMEQGRIVEIGRHADLLAQSGRYAQLYRMQFSAVTPLEKGGGA